MKEVAVAEAQARKGAPTRSSLEDLVGCRLVRVKWLMEGIPRLFFRCRDGDYEYDPPVPCWGYPDWVTKVER